jgi:hypothetical protein
MLKPTLKLRAWSCMVGYALGLHLQFSVAVCWGVLFSMAPRTPGHRAGKRKRGVRITTPKGEITVPRGTIFGRHSRNQQNAFIASATAQ